MNEIHHRLINKYKLQCFFNHVVGFMYQIRFSIEKHIKGNGIIVYTFGKTGSRSIVETIRNMGLKRPIYHVHRISQEGLRFVKDKSLALGRAYPGNPYWTGKFLSDQICLNESNTWDIVVLVRDPVARNLSAFFHAQDYWYPELRRITDEENHSDEVYLDIRQVFLEKFNHKKPLNWFDLEINKVFGINVFNTSFLDSQGYQIIQNQRINLLILKLEVLNEVYKQAFRDFFTNSKDIPDIIRANIASDRSYSHIYQKFLDWLTLPEEYLDLMYHSRYATHFYSPEEIAVFREKWSILNN